MEYTVRIHKKDGTIEKKVEAGTNLLKFLRKNSVDVSAPCGGHGTCGKCKVLVTGLSEEPSKKERKYLDRKLEEKGYRLACYNQINHDIDIFIGNRDVEAVIQTDIRQKKIKLQPLITKKTVELASPSLEDQHPDIDRAFDALETTRIGNSLSFLRQAPELLRSEEWKITKVYLDDKLIAVEPGDTAASNYGVAVDIGTTTIAAYLIDMTTGEKLDVYSMLNPQKKYGADVISRIQYTNESQQALDEMRQAIITCINQIIAAFEKRKKIRREDIYAVTLVGNTVMMHFIMGLSARYIAISPFIPVTTRLHQFKAEELGIDINPFGYAVLLPSVAAYIGADTVGAVLSSGMYKLDQVSLLIDIGTNGEIVLGSSQWLYACSVAAGPAFEGAHIRNGVGGIQGAIDSVKLNNNLQFSTIGNSKAVGICGSGIVDIISELLKAGILDGTGRMPDPEEMEEGWMAHYAGRLTEVDGYKAFLLVKSEDCDAGMDIAVTQKDVRELQNAKAAIAAGIKTLIKHAGISMKDIDKVYLAGGFGSYINIESALNIGLLPKELAGRVESIGNAAGAGAVESLISVKALKKAEKLRNCIKYIELSADKNFVDDYIHCMTFEN